MKWRVVLPIAIGALLIAAFAAWWLHTFERVSDRIDLPRTGEAAINPLFDLGVVLEKTGRRVTSWRRLEPAAMRLGAHDTVLYDGDPRRLPQRARDALLDWVRGGGHLIVATPAPDAASDVFEHSDDGSGAVYVDVPLLDDIGLRVRRGAAGCIESLPDAFCSARRFDPPLTATRRIGDDDGDAFARVPLGRGRIDVVASLDVLTDQALKSRANAEFTHQLFADADPRGRVHLVHASDLPSLWGTLARHGWPVWLPLLILLIGWLWARMPRFGPLQPSPALERRSLIEHVAASGEHHWRYGRADALHAAARDAFFARLRRRDPQAAALDGEVQALRLVERTRMPKAQIVDALIPPDPRDRKALVVRIATLIRMRNRL